VRLNQNIGMLLLAIWLILTGLLPLLNISIRSSGIILAVLAIAAGIMIVLGSAGLGRDTRSVALTRNLGMLVLAIWLILTGLFSAIRITFPASGILLAALAVAAGVLILLRR
jgi:hypothetical protein